MTAILARISGLVLVAIATLVIISNTNSHKVTGYQVTGIFDDAAFAVPGEEVRIAGATVGSIRSLDVTPQHKAAVTMQITDRRFTPFHADGTCSIRPQSLIGEKYIDCLPGSAGSPVLGRIGNGHGKGTYYLPVTRTHSPVDSDIVQDIYREPIRQRFALIIDELGTGLAARGSDLNAVIHRADPALGYTDQVIKILAGQNRQLAQLASDSDTVLAPLARVRRQLQGFIVGANTTSSASATQAAATSASIRLFPTFLRQLRPLLVQLSNLADQGTPLMASLAQSAPALGRQFQNLAPFARAARPALISLGHYSQLSQPQLLGTLGLDERLLHVGRQALPTGKLLDTLTASLDSTGGIEQLMSLLYYGTSASNGFDSSGHYLRSEPLVGSCTTYDTTPVPDCSANFGSASSAAVSRVAHTAVARTTPSTAAPRALLRFLIGNGR
jgi:phospholipid/cholesterol/gamma-HCH transport system substrate-binding protein